MPSLYIADIFTFAGRTAGVLGLVVLLFWGLASAIPWFLWCFGLLALSMVYCFTVNLAWSWRLPGKKRKCCRKCASKGAVA